MSFFLGPGFQEVPVLYMGHVVRDRGSRCVRFDGGRPMPSWTDLRRAAEQGGLGVSATHGRTQTRPVWDCQSGLPISGFGGFGGSMGRQSYGSPREVVSGVYHITWLCGWHGPEVKATLGAEGLSLPCW